MADLSNYTGEIIDPHRSSSFQQPDTPQSLQVIQQQSPHQQQQMTALMIRALSTMKGIIHKHGNHTDEWRQGYRDGFTAGQQDKANGIDKNAC